MASPNFDPRTLVPSQEIVNEVLTPSLTGGVLSLILCGMCIPRLFDYYSHFPQDRRRNKIGVAVVGLGIIAYAVMQLVFAIKTGSMRVHTISSLYTSSANTSLLPLASGAIALPTHIILAERAWKLNRGNRLLGACLALLAITPFVGSILASVYTFLARKDVLAYGSALYIIIPASFIIYLITDLAIVFWTVLGLRRYSKTFLANQQEGQGFGGANLITAAWQTSVESAVFPTCLNIITLVLYYLYPAGLYFATPSFMIPPVYCLTLLFSLERRQAHLAASHFRAHLPSVSTSRDRRPQTTKVASTVHCSTHVTQHVEGSIAVTFTGDGRSSSVQVQMPGSEVTTEELYPKQSGSFEMKTLPQ